MRRIGAGESRQERTYYLGGTTSTLFPTSRGSMAGSKGLIPFVCLFSVCLLAALVQASALERSPQILGRSTNVTLAKRQSCVQGQQSPLCAAGLVCALAPRDNGFYCCQPGYNYYCGAFANSTTGKCSATECSTTPPGAKPPKGAEMMQNFPLGFVPVGSYPHPPHNMVAAGGVPSSHSSQTLFIPPMATSETSHGHWLFSEITARLGLRNARHVPYVAYEGPDGAVIGNYVPGQEDEIALFVGHTVRIKDVFQDGWASGWNMVTGGFGMFPLSLIDFTLGNSPSVRHPMSIRGVSLAVATAAGPRLARKIVLFL
ncbi:hypothetical protein M427DRAFT_35448 [Gonapodya prolifera JEL478]|uniref:SH3 domain-containing protein n=1 Tax=Gonapodya prolifera (strain JEL478) TaxID=1344416 RepID=A0A139A4F3_GONPJ|nr:hypothetical protein M427DRAFT_35448 [Gonapodya prolifera JEL478]|eukprot:KXS11696.1 hypothetical protein M427DRAFT_35448 [Gonapodya prolifera JEL478]